MKNQQPKEGRSDLSQQFLDLHSIFYTIQGEGIFAGFPAVFVRLAGCNLQCPLCDTDYTEGRRVVDVDEIVNTIHALIPYGTKPLVVITGGEPFRQDLGYLVCELISQGYRVQIETNGTAYQEDFPYEYDEVTIMCSPKNGSLHPRIRNHIDGFKYVIHADHINIIDGLPTSALGLDTNGKVARPPRGYDGPIYVQPVDEKDENLNRRHTDATKAMAMKHGYIFCLQVHKFIDVE